ncbi:hypothetical protein C9427_01030 [Mesorhizobium helmanticense]|uniref:Uncharacterized protein n=2 Tax=Mesorhizobium helmanticense TaxID=1776423 RepID=A0A2T4J2S2_9HYPH|nr:hypothetical protein C9427_01030 [Mesorhizobium helmanticense]
MSMVESLLSVSGINLFGHFVIDLQVVNPLLNPIVAQVASAENIPALIDNKDVNGVPVVAGDRIVVWKQRVLEQIEVYTVNAAGVPWTKGDTAAGAVIQVTGGDSFVGYFMKLENGFEFIGRRQGAGNRTGQNRLLENQLENGRFARIYGFSFEGSYYDLPRPVIFLVHGDGELVAEDLGKFSPARSPSPTGLTGLAAADFDFADGLRVWSYDKADYTVRMDVETGMFEDVLLAAIFGGGPGGMDAAGMSARGMSAKGMSARGMSARGMSARGMSARGGGNSD